MTYATLDGLIAAFGESHITDVSDRDGSGMLDEATVAAAIVATDSLINSYIDRRYTLPLDTVPELLVELANDIARYKLHISMVPEVVQARYDQALRTLRDIGNGVASLGIKQAGTQSSAENLTYVVPPNTSKWRM